MQATPYSLILLVSFLFAIFICNYVRRKSETEINRYIYYVMLSVMVWLFFGTLAAMSTSIAGKIFFSKWEYFGITTTPILFLIFVLKYTHFLSRLKLIHYLSLFLIPALGILAVFTNELHHLFWTEVSLTTTRLSGITGYYSRGLFFWLSMSYSYLMVTLSLIILVRTAFRYPQLYSRQVSIIIISAILPILGNFIYLFALKELSGMDFTPVAFLLVCVLVWVCIRMYGLLKIRPLARDFLFESMIDGVLFVDNNGYIIDLNTAAKEMLGLHDEKALEQISRKIELKFPELFGMFKSKLTDLELQVNQTQMRYIDVKVHHLNDNRDEQLGKVFILRDITESKTYHDIIQKQNQEMELLINQKDKMLSIISHDLRSPLNSIAGLADMMQTSFHKIPAETQISYLSKFQSRLRATIDLTENLLYWAANRTPDSTDYVQDIEMSVLFRDVVFLYQSIASDKQIAIKITPNHQVHKAIKANRQYVMTIVRNLLSNAIKFTPNGGSITLAYEYLPKHCLISISDTGIGISPEIASNLFGMDKSDYTLGTNGEIGSGIGLGICKFFAKKMGGDIFVESTPGQGSKMSFTLKYAE